MRGRTPKVIIYVDTDGVACVCRICNACKEMKSLESFSRQNNGFMGRVSRCKECIKPISRAFYKRNPNYRKDHYRRNKNVIARKREIRNGLERSLPMKIRVKTFEERSKKIISCQISGTKEDVVVDHFIAIGVGHGGTYVGNLVFLSRDLNSYKGAINPFEWAKSLCEEAQKKFDNVASDLALINGLTPSEFEKYVTWCYENPRDLVEGKADQRSSIELWRERTGLLFPLPKFVYERNIKIQEKKRRRS
ncbi:UNVERIFIED_CONTAM: hypothetical protein FO487_13305 [Bacillus amyloliquefaciens DSM 7 = ATCC 23350]|uniref:HNH endonuclease n=1 Tax=Bacillus amyloliquefaciens (strain ATCC 23350 / DSM 7 / BCRC 11601 / CCUG 28519 / NBRC 15535 / NRRL B-14393 / F) TaxID=692420 RepID=A0A9P1JFH7_BACAS|nr:hypothetical protein [Bacillus amyloliquefaciens]MDR4375182.1 hypothetical protein [Bacillus amyloliquefaciens]MEC1838059.1 hypothetical protein [Bacillus amyloliquefaciens]MEC1846819.1 hypothetical protein [Bacillus amyloliquefaciens]MEC1930512.1 hypothetical protein [Bacillus amyloliquefaciens]MEC2021088.1 hypothetical protein [Bacillus amyloliquefaciens]